jgi:hypothetical protein
MFVEWKLTKEIKTIANSPSKIGLLVNAVIGHFVEIRGHLCAYRPPVIKWRHLKF